MTKGILKKQPRNPRTQRTERMGGLGEYIFPLEKPILKKHLEDFNQIVGKNKARL